MTDQEIEKLAGALAEAIVLAITPSVRAAIREELDVTPPPIQGVSSKRDTLKLPRRG